ncbi:hypothetical protein KC343_g25 [Hortaea werneckii]|nr:hypothetical protein KC343_g25 [Hortaea werneckii]
MKSEGTNSSSCAAFLYPSSQCRTLNAREMGQGSTLPGTSSILECCEMMSLCSDLTSLSDPFISTALTIKTRQTVNRHSIASVNILHHEL